MARRILSLSLTSGTHTNVGLQAKTAVSHRDKARSQNLQAMCAQDLVPAQSSAPLWEILWCHQDFCPLVPSHLTFLLLCLLLLLSRWRLQFLEHKKPGSCQCSDGRCVLPLGLVFYPEHHLRTDTGGYIWANPDKLLAFSLQINSACPGGFWTMPALPEECSSHL